VQKNWLLHHDSAPSHTSFFHQAIFVQKQYVCRPQSTIFFSVSAIEGKTERPLDTIETIEAESRAVTNIQNAFKK
jgi:hypothetical protein